MNYPSLLAIGRAVPAASYTQAQLYAYRQFKDNPLIERLFLDSPIVSRGLFVPPSWYQTAHSLTECNAAWREGALLLGSRAVRQALSGAGIDASDVDHFAVTTVTGYTTPGLDLLLAHQEGMRNTISRAHLNCIGCHAAIPLLKLAVDHVRTHPGSTSVALAVEVCSACLRHDDDPQNLVALSLFADGAAAAVVGDGPGPMVIDVASVYDYAHLGALGFELSTEGFRIVLDPAIPTLIASHIGQAVDGLLAKHGIARSQVSTWCFHPGGSRILDEVERCLGLTPQAMAPSRHVLHHHGNMSSPSVLFVLAEALNQSPPPPGTFGVLAAFGPGLGIELALLRF